MKKHVVIILVLICAFAISTWITDMVFIAKSPRVNPLFISRVYSIPSTSLAYLSRLFQQKPVPTVTQQQLAQQTQPQKSATSSQGKITNYNSIAFSQSIAKIPKITPPPKIIFKPISKGVYAAEDIATKKIYYKIDKGTVMDVRVYTITMSDGSQKEVTFYIPKN